MCERCEFEAEDLGQLDVDHIVRRSEGGTDDPSNLVVLCANCHRLKTRRERRAGWDYEAFMLAGKNEATQVTVSVVP